jgi:hypothetical protein
MAAEDERTVDWDAFWAAHPGSLTVPVDISLHQAREASVFLAGRAVDAAELRGWLQMFAFLPYESAPPAKYRTEQGATFNSYRRPGQ